LIKPNKEQNKKPDIFLFHNYREFLKKWLEFQRLTGKAVTLRSLARAMNVSPGYISDILAGHKPMTKPIYKQLCRHLTITTNEKSFLWYLIQLSDADDLPTREAAFKKIKRFGSYQARHQQELVTHEFLCNWLTVVIRELATLKEFKLDANWIRQKLKYKANIAEIKSALQFLLNNEFLKKDIHGKITYQDKLIRADQDVLKLAMAHYHTGFMDLAAKSIYVTPSEDRHLLNYTVSIPANAFAQIRNILEGALKSVTSSADEAKAQSTPDSVYNVTFYAFPLTEKPADTTDN
jgi:uncharacterized protein (TIGR02147 family)